MDELALRQINGGDDEDAALRRALALSMGDADEAPGPDSGDEDIEEPSEARNAAALSERENAAGASQSREHVRSASTATTASAASSSQPSPEQLKAEDKLVRAAKGKQHEQASAARAGATPSSTASTAAPSLSLLNLDRKAMEAQRLARRQQQLEKQQQPQQQQHVQKSRGARQQSGSQETQQGESLQKSWRLQQQPKSTKRKADKDIIVIDDDEDDDGKNEDDDISGEDGQNAGSPLRARPARRPRLDDGSAGKANGSKGSPHPSRPFAVSDSATAKAVTRAMPLLEPSVVTPRSPPLSLPPFAKGAVKKTWVRGQPRIGDDVTIEELWQKSDLELAVLSSFQWDEDWMMARLDIRKTRLMLIAYASDSRQKEQMRANVPGDMVRFCFPPMQAMGFMHSKLQLLKFPGHLRLVIPTGNLTPYDWGESGTIENMVFVIDLPRLPKESRGPSGGEQSFSTPFLEDLAYFLKAQGVEESLIRSLRNYDFAETARYAFVHSMAGSHVDESWKRTGYSGLGRAVKAMGWESSRPIQVDYICSSIGSVNDDLLNALYYACQGDSGFKEFEARTSKSRRGKGKDVAAASTSPASQVNPRNCLRLYFPSQETVADSIGGKNNAGTVCFQAKWWDAPTFPHEILRDGQNVRQGVLLHTKLLLARPGDAQETPGHARPRGWAYLGSANMSESAWGRLVKDKATGRTKMTCRNWECGVLIPVASDQDEQASSVAEDAKMLDIFRHTLPIPITVPSIKYCASDNKGGRRPWFFMEG